MSSAGSKRSIIVIGHKNPDTDSVCAAIGYAALMNKWNASINEKEGLPVPDEYYEPRRAGELSSETAFVLDRFGVAAPRICLDISSRVMDLDIRHIDGISRNVSLRGAWTKMKENDIKSLPVVDNDGKLEGIISVTDIALANVDTMDAGTLSSAGVPISNILDTISGTLVCGDINTVINQGRIIVGAGSPELMESAIEPGDIVMVANRYESQLCAIDMGASCLITCLSPSISKTIVKMAGEHGCIIISTPHDTYSTALLLHQSIPVRHFMTGDTIHFNLKTSIYDVKDVMSRVRFDYFPVLDENDRYFGMISKRNIFNASKRKVVLVDHNEKSQCVSGLNEAQVCGIIDHHRLGDIETDSPVFVRNQPVGCTSTIVWQMYKERSIEIDPPVAGLLLSAIISDTLCLNSPTCTGIDRVAAENLAVLAAVDISSLARELFNAGESLAGKTAEELLEADYKVYRQGDIAIGVGQGNFVSRDNFEKAEEMVEECMDRVFETMNVDMLFYIVTDVIGKKSDVLFRGAGCDKLLTQAFNTNIPKGERCCVTIEGLMSRKKQFIPTLLSAMK